MIRRPAYRAFLLLLALAWSAALVPLQVHVHGVASGAGRAFAAASHTHAAGHDGDACPLCAAAWNLAFACADPPAAQFDRGGMLPSAHSSDPACSTLLLRAVRGPPPVLA